MKTKITISAILFFVLIFNGFSQEKSKKQIKEERKIEQQKQIEAMINAKEFVFVGRTALPTGYNSVNLATNPNYVKFHPEMIESYMPYFGRAYSGVGYGGDQGLKFEGKPEPYTFKKEKKNFQVEAKVKGGNDLFTISLYVGFEGDATLTIASNNRSSISYQGEISAPEEPKEKK